MLSKWPPCFPEEESWPAGKSATPSTINKIVTLVIKLNSGVESGEYPLDDRHKFIIVCDKAKIPQALRGYPLLLLG